MTILSSATLQQSSTPHTKNLSRLSAYDFPAGLASSVQRELGWTWGYTLRVMAEYRRFLLLAATTGQPVTPSRTVDEVWHRHLTFSRDYWETLTPLLPGPLHHEPSAGEPGDRERYTQQYAHTLAAYRAEFGAEPPADIWPTPQARRPQPTLWFAPLLAVLAGAALVQGASLLFLLLLAAGVLLALAHAGRLRPPSRQGSATSSSGGSVFGADSGSDSGCDGGSGCGGGCGS